MKGKKYAVVYILNGKGSGGLSLTVRRRSHLLFLVFGENDNSLCRIGGESVADFPRQQLLRGLDLFRVGILVVGLRGDAPVSMLQFALHQVRRHFIGGEVGGVGSAQILRGPRVMSQVP